MHSGRPGGYFCLFGQRVTELLRIDGLTAGYGGSAVLHDVGMVVNQGETVSLIGPNGAGKSTLLNTVAGLVSSTSGHVEFRGMSIQRRRADWIVRLGLSLVPERRQLFNDMSVEENMLIGAYALPAANKAVAIRDLLHEQFERFPRLAERRRQLAGSLSGGEQQMLAIARALMSRPHLLLLDEPSLGLAPLFVSAVFELAKQLRHDGLSILLVEQNAHAALRIADRAYVLESGRVVLAGDARLLQKNQQVRIAYLGGGLDGERGMERRIRSNADRDSGRHPDSSFQEDVSLAPIERIWVRKEMRFVRWSAWSKAGYGGL